MWDDPDLYDLETAWYVTDLPYWQGLLAEYRPVRVLELGCGTGRLALPLARRGAADLIPGFRLVGLDRSAALLARAQARLAAEPPLAGAVRFVAGDMRAFDLGEMFDLIVLGFNTLAYLHTRPEQLACLTAVRRHLAPGGRFAIDLILPLAGFLAEAAEPDPPAHVELDHAVPAAGVTRFERIAVDHYDPLTQTDYTEYRYTITYADGRVEHRSDELAWHMYFPCELEGLLEQAGLRPVVRYGGYDRRPWGPGAEMYLWVMTAA